MKRESKQSKRLKLTVPSNFFSTWYMKHGRAFPWRESGVSPFGILLAEILLRQTRAEMAARVWPILTREYPDPVSLASAAAMGIFEIIKELGFGNQRTQALIELGASLKLMKELPSDPQELMMLPHVGLYTAHAVACFGFKRRGPVVDLNVVRVISRITGTEPPKDIRRGAEWVWKLAASMLPQSRVAEHNYGILDFAATVCKSRSPECAGCLIVSHCKTGKSTVLKMRDCE